MAMVAGRECLLFSVTGGFGGGAGALALGFTLLMRDMP